MQEGKIDAVSDAALRRDLMIAAFLMNMTAGASVCAAPSLCLSLGSCVCWYLWHTSFYTPACLYITTAGSWCKKSFLFLSLAASVYWILWHMLTLIVCALVHLYITTAGAPVCASVLLIACM